MTNLNSTLKTSASASTIERFDAIEGTIFRAPSRNDLYRNPDFVADLYAYLDENACADGILSLDIFDTFLLRDNSSEFRRFVEIGERMASLIAGIAPIDAFLARHFGTVASYRAGRLVDGCGEGSLTEIHRTAGRLLGASDDFVNAFVNAELDYESTRMWVNPALLGYVHRHRNRGGRVILVSDMYMHADQIRCLLEKLSVDLRLFEFVFSSADSKVSKASGGIFSLIEAAVGASPPAFLHLGDSLKGDYVNPRVAGWRSLHLPISRAEVEVRRQDHLEMADLLKRTFGLTVDIGLPK